MLQLRKYTYVAIGSLLEATVNIEDAPRSAPASRYIRHISFEDTVLSIANEDILLGECHPEAFRLTSQLHRDAPIQGHAVCQSIVLERKRNWRNTAVGSHKSRTNGKGTAEHDEDDLRQQHFLEWIHYVQGSMSGKTRESNLHKDDGSHLSREVQPAVIRYHGLESALRTVEDFRGRAHSLVWDVSASIPSGYQYSRPRMRVGNACKAASEAAHIEMKRESQCLGGRARVGRPSSDWSGVRGHSGALSWSPAPLSFERHILLWERRFRGIGFCSAEGKSSM